MPIKWQCRTGTVFGIAPSGTWMCRFHSQMLLSNAQCFGSGLQIGECGIERFFHHIAQISVMVSCPFPLLTVDSINRIFPAHRRPCQSDVHATRIVFAVFVVVIFWFTQNALYIFRAYGDIVVFFCCYTFRNIAYLPKQ